jgi:hypothetical protein
MIKKRSAVLRPSADINILISLAVFGLSVAATRIFLQLTGFPQIGGSVLHIAHAIWGGLLLFVAVLVTLVLANRWAFTLSAVVSGLGVGLFIDEVGKFITQANDYFFPPAAPLIYSFFLLVVLFFVFVRRSRQANPRTSMYRVLLGLREVLDNDLDPREREHLLAELENGRSASEPHIVLLAEQLTTYLQSETIPISSYRPGLWVRLIQWVRAIGEGVGRKNHRRIIVAITILIGVSALFFAALLVVAWLWPAQSGLILSSVLLSATELTTQNPIWLVVRLALQLVIGTLYLLALLRLLQGREDTGIQMAIIASLLSLTGLHLLNFYLNQFSSLTGLFVDFVTLLLLLAYRSWYLTGGEAAEPAL